MIIYKCAKCTAPLRMPAKLSLGAVIDCEYCEAQNVFDAPEPSLTNTMRNVFDPLGLFTAPDQPPKEARCGDPNCQACAANTMRLAGLIGGIL